ncbi:MAG TPA: class I SAM-dependent methyltransferase [Casimicrobiaceae bacterium]|jgi:SAM-dependent methyltransferase
MTAPSRSLRLAPSPWIERYVHLIPKGARVLDLAAGSGRHALFFAARGNRVVAVDRDESSLAAIASENIEARVLDLETDRWPLIGEIFDAIVVVNYLHRASLSKLFEMLASDGTLLYETFAVGNEAYGRPTNPDFLLRKGELLELVRERLTVVAFDQGLSSNRDKPAVIERIAAVGLARAWPPSLSP